VHRVMTGLGLLFLVFFLVEGKRRGERRGMRGEEREASKRVLREGDVGEGRGRREKREKEYLYIYKKASSPLISWSKPRFGASSQLARSPSCSSSFARL
jgi:hypothetical protein